MVRRQKLVDGTWLDAEELAYNVPLSRSPRRFRAYLQLGTNREMVEGRAGVPDTYFSIPAIAKVEGRNMKGYLTISSGLGTMDAGALVFHPDPTGEVAARDVRRNPESDILENPRTRDIDLHVNDYGSAVRFLRGRRERKLANNTFVRQEDESSVSVVLHRTPVVTYYSTGLIMLRSGGYHSTTTKQRINQLLPPGWSLYQQKYNWYLRAPDGEVQDFFDGIAIHAGLRTHGTSSRTPEHQPHPGPSVPKWYKNPGKFSDTIEELCYHNPDQELGESESFGWYGLISGFLLPDARELAASDNVDSDEFESDAEEYDWPLNAIISEDSQGFIRMETYKNNRDAIREWHKLEQDYETFGS